MFGAFVAAALGTLFTSACVSLVAVPLGLGLGSLAGRGQGLWDALSSRLLELAAALPALLAVQLLAKTWSPVASVVLVLGTYQGLRLARLCRNESRLVRRRQFVHAARVLGLSRTRTLWRHVLPHAAPALTVGITLTLPMVAAMESALTLLDLDNSPSWGGYITGRQPGWVLALFALVAATFGLQLAAEYLVERVLPHTRSRASTQALASRPERSR